MSAIYKSFGENVRQKRKDLGLSQENFAELIKRDVRSVIAIETGQRNPTLRTIYNICRVLKSRLQNCYPFRGREFFQPAFLPPPYLQAHHGRTK